MNPFKFFFYAAAVAAGVGLASCSMPDMRVSQGMREETTAMPVVGRSMMRVSLGKEKGFGFGKYQLENIERGWTRRNGPIDNLVIQDTDAYQKYSFGVRDSVQQKTWYVQAAAMHNAKTTELAGVSINLDKQRELLQVVFQSEESGTWRLALADPGHYLERRNFLGKLSNGAHELEVYPLYKWEGKSLPSSTALGYEFSKDGHVLATVQTVNNGKVWLKNTLSPDLQMVLASACGSLLLYNKLDDENQ